MLSVFAFIIGAAAWTLAEYAIHRGFGHRRGAKNPFSVEHLKHHATVSYFAPSWKKALAAAIVMLVLSPPLTYLLGIPGASGALGFVVMYVTYEIIHRRLHTHAPITRYGRWARRHHFHHHFSRPRMNHGVTTPVWDFVFGTLDVPERVQLPRYNVPAWMLGPEGKLRPELAQEYRPANAAG